MKYFAIALLGLSFPHVLYCQLSFKSDKSDIKEVYERAVIETPVINFTASDGYSQFISSLDLNLQTVRQSANNSSLNISQRLKGIRRARNEARSILRMEYVKEYQNVPDGPDQDARQREIKRNFHKAIVAARITVNKQYRNVFDLAETKMWLFFPARNARFSQLYYDSIRSKTSLIFLRNHFLTFNSDFGALSSEIVAGNLFPLRVSFNTAISKARQDEIDPSEIEGKDSNEIEEIVMQNYEENLSKNTLSHVLAGGGLLALKAQYPLLYLNPLWAPNLSFDSEMTYTFSGQFTAAGSEVPQDKMPYWSSFGFINNIYVPLINFSQNDEESAVFGIFIQYNINLVVGSNAFMTNLNLKGEDRGKFWFNELRSGVFFNGVQATYTWLRFSNDYLDDLFPNTFKLSYAPGKMKGD